MPFWLLMIFAPKWRYTQRLMGSMLGIILPALMYSVLIFPQLGGLGPLLANSQFPKLAMALGRPEGTAVAWLHFLAFDLFVGRWIYLDSREQRISPWWVSPTLFMTLMIGPFGLLSYLLLCKFLAKQPDGSASVAA
ncbi:MAG: DUF4281 domain-containing protein [Myxococcales bacterium]|nr:DUF4281 domain-containing protein [Myxococcales bacterium]